MSALRPRAAEKRTSIDVGEVPILLQKSAISRVWRLSLVVLSHRFPPAPLRAAASTLWCRRLQRLYPARGDCWRRPGHQFGKPTKVLGDGCQRELVLCTARAAQPKATKP